MSERTRSACALPVLIVSVLLMICQSLASADAPVTTSKRGRKLAQAAVEMIREVLATGLPRSVPEWMKEELPGQEFEGNRRRQPAWAFFVPEVLSDEAPRLCRRAVRFWSTSPNKLVEAIPFLGPMYLRETDPPMKSAILETIMSIVGQARLARRFRTLAEPTCLSILQGTAEDDRREWIVRQCLKVVAPLSSQGTAEVLRMATEDDADIPEVLCAEIELLAITAEDGPVDSSLNEFLLRFLESSGGECRGWAVDSVLLKRYGKDRVLPVYLRVLRDVLNSDPILAKTILIEISLDLVIPEVTPVLMEALRSELPGVRLQAAVGLEHTTGLGSKDMGYVAELDVASVAVVTGEISGGRGRAELELICARWEKWWETSGADFMREHGLNPDGSPLSGSPPAATPAPAR